MRRTQTEIIGGFCATVADVISATMANDPPPQGFRLEVEVEPGNKGKGVVRVRWVDTPAMATCGYEPEDE